MLNKSNQTAIDVLESCFSMKVTGSKCKEQAIQQESEVDIGYTWRFEIIVYLKIYCQDINGEPFIFMIKQPVSSFILFWLTRY